jgi:hypothetical protein
MGKAACDAQQVVLASCYALPYLSGFDGVSRDSNAESGDLPRCNHPTIEVVYRPQVQAAYHRQWAWRQHVRCASHRRAESGSPAGDGKAP